MKNKYTFYNNLKYFFNMIVTLDKGYFLILIWSPVISLCVSIAEVFLPKVVLDGISQNKNITMLVFEIVLLVTFITVFKFLQVKYKNKLEIKSWKFYFLYGQMQVEKKKMVMNYSLFTSPYGKQISEKAFYSVCGNPDSSFVSLFSHLKDSVVNIITIVCFGAILSKLNPLIIVFLLCSYIIDGVVALIIEKFRKNIREKEADIWRKKKYISLYTTLSDFAKDIRIFNLKDLINTKRELLLEEEIKNTDNKGKFTVIQLSVETLLVLIRDGISYGYLVYKIVNYDISIGDFMLYFTIITGFGSILQNLVNSIQQTSQSNNNMKFFREFMDCEEEKTDGKSSALLKSHTIRMEHVSFSYPGSKTTILKNINIVIEQGKSYAIVGINGAGKTTLAKLLCGLLRPTEGKIYMDDVDITEISDVDYFNCFSAIFQESCLMPVSIAQNITLSHGSYDENKLKKCIKDAGLDEKISLLKNGVETLIGKQFDNSATELSGGEIQKVLLARALYKNAPILILDEPTAAMDPVSEEQLYKKYKDLTMGKTSIYITHRLSSTRFCEKILLVEGNEIRESGTHDELYKMGGKYRELFDVSAKYYNEVRDCV